MKNLPVPVFLRPVDEKDASMKVFPELIFQVACFFLAPVTDVDQMSQSKTTICLLLIHMVCYRIWLMYPCALASAVVCCWCELIWRENQRWRFNSGSQCVLQ